MTILRLDTLSATIHARPEKVWEFVADPNNWKQFSDFGRDIEYVEGDEWVAHTSQGDVRVRLFLDAARLVLDQVCTLANGDEQLIPYRIVPRGVGCDLMMTNQQTTNVSDEAYAEQLEWMRQELANVKRIMEGSPAK